MSYHGKPIQSFLNFIACPQIARLRSSSLCQLVGFGAFVKLVPVTEQNIQAVMLRALYSTMNEGDAFIVMPVPDIKKIIE